MDEELNTFTPEDDEALASLRSRGFAVCVFSPEELKDASSDHVEDRLVELGWEVIECAQED